MKIRRYKGEGGGELIQFLTLPLELNHLSLVSSDFHETFQGSSTSGYIQIQSRDFDIFCPSKDMPDFLNLQGKLDSPTLMKANEICRGQ